MKSFSPFRIERKKLELSFTYYYFIGYSVSLSSNIVNDSDLISSEDSAFIKVDWKKSETLNNFRESYGETILLDKFNLNSSLVLKGENIISETNATKYSFGFGKIPLKDDDPIDPAGIECYLLSNGHFVLRVNLVNLDGIPAYDVLQLTRHPELLTLDGSDGRTGSLVRNLEGYIDIIEKKLMRIVHENLNKIKVNSLEKGKDRSIAIENRELKREDKRTIKRSRPYIGTLFSLDNLDKSQLESVMPSVKKFVIASARTTPSFLSQFSEPCKYLEGDNRNIYTPGKSIVYLARRGWCVFNHGDHYPIGFRLSVLECTYLVVISCNSMSRVWSLFIQDIKKHGEPVFDELNGTVKVMVARPWWHFLWSFFELFEFHHRISRATSFIASSRIIMPESDSGKLLEAHMMSHTARAAVARCETLASYETLEKSASVKIGAYSNYLNVASNYFRSKTAQYARVSILISLFALLWSVFFNG